MNLKKRVATLLIPIMLIGAPFLTYAESEITIVNKLPWDKEINKGDSFSVNLEVDLGDKLPIGETDVFFLSAQGFRFDKADYSNLIDGSIKITTQSGITDRKSVV